MFDDANPFLTVVISLGVYVFRVQQVERSFTSTQTPSLQMAPSIIQPRYSTDIPRIVSKGAKQPLRPSQSLDKFEHFEVTPVIGTEFKDVQLTSLLSAPNSDELIRDLAILGMSFKIGADISGSTQCCLLPESRYQHRATKVSRNSSWRTQWKAGDIEITYSSVDP